VTLAWTILNGLQSNRIAQWLARSAYGLGDCGVNDFWGW